MICESLSPLSGYLACLDDPAFADVLSNKDQ